MASDWGGLGASTWSHPNESPAVAQKLPDSLRGQTPWGQGAQTFLWAPSAGWPSPVKGPRQPCPLHPLQGKAHLLFKGQGVGTVQLVLNKLLREITNLCSEKANVSFSSADLLAMAMNKAPSDYQSRWLKEPLTATAETSFLEEPRCLGNCQGTRTSYSHNYSTSLLGLLRLIK